MTYTIGKQRVQFLSIRALWWMFMKQIQQIRRDVLQITVFQQNSPHRQLIIWTHQTDLINWNNNKCKPFLGPKSRLWNLTYVFKGFLKYHTRAIAYMLSRTINYLTKTWGKMGHLSFRNTKFLHQTLNPTAELWCKTLSRINLIWFYTELKL